jgi:hypothetical protein
MITFFEGIKSLRNKTIFIAFVVASLMFFSIVNGREIIKTEKKLTFTYDSENSIIRVIDHEQSQKTIKIEELKGVKDIQLNMSISPSNNGDFLLVSFSASEQDYIVQVYSLGSQRKLFEESVDDAAWLDNSNLVIMIPKSSEDYLPIDKGLLIFDPINIEKHIEFGTLFFVGEIKAIKEHSSSRTIVNYLDGKLTRVARVYIEDGKAKIDVRNNK